MGELVQLPVRLAESQPTAYEKATEDKIVGDILSTPEVSSSHADVATARMLARLAGAYLDKNDKHPPRT